MSATITDGFMSATITDLFHDQLRALVDQWLDPEWWRREGAMWDSRDCAEALKKLIPATVDPLPAAGAPEGQITAATIKGEGVEYWHAYAQSQADTIDWAAARLSLLREALIKFADHLAGCHAFHGGPCTCGLDAALTSGDDQAPLT